MERMRFQDGITFIAGILLIAAPFVSAIVPPEGAGIALLTTNFVGTGPAAVILGAAALFYFRAWEEWLGIVLGVWLVASPWILGFVSAQAAMWTAVVCGVVIAAMSAWRAMEEVDARAH